MKKAFFIIVLAVTVVACNQDQNKNSTSGQTDSAAIETIQTTNTGLFGTEWKLLELEGKAIVMDTTFKKEPFLVFEKDTEKITGNGSCNGFMGSYKLKENNGIELKLGGATMMACPNLSIETKFMELLEQAKSYRIEGNNLFLESGDEAEMVKLEAVGQ